MKRSKLTLYIRRHGVRIFSEKEMGRTVCPTYYQRNKFENILAIHCHEYLNVKT